MRRVLIISPHFPPVNGADMHRVRVSLRYYPEFGWSPEIIAATVDSVENAWIDDSLKNSIPATVPIRRVSAFPVRYLRRIGFGSLAFRVLFQLYREGVNRIREAKPDLIFFSTTQFPVMILGRLWRRQFGVPYLLDIQDPWATGIRKVDPAWEKPIKHRLIRTINKRLEPFAMRHAGGLMAVSQGFIDSLQDKYPFLRLRPSSTIRFAASRNDLRSTASASADNNFFKVGDGCLHGVYIGRGGYNVATSLRILFRAFVIGLNREATTFQKVRLHFVGTDYAPAGRERKTVKPIAEEFGLQNCVFESPIRVSYATVLKLQHDADFLLMPGSDEPEYAASKLCGCILAKKPLLAIFHRDSPAVDVIRATNSGEVFVFDNSSDGETLAKTICKSWSEMLGRLPFIPDTDWNAFEPCTARETTRRQCELFDLVLGADGKNTTHLEL